MIALQSTALGEEDTQVVSPEGRRVMSRLRNKDIKDGDTMSVA